MPRLCARSAAGCGHRYRRGLERGEELSLPEPDFIVCADWSKASERRAAWVADVSKRLVSPISPPGRGWTVGALLDEAQRLAGGGSVLVAFDAPLGVPRSYFHAYTTKFGALESFSDWIAHALAQGDFLVPVTSPEDWAVERPFFRIPPGKGGLTGFVRAAEALGIDLKREIERRMHAKSVFAMGIPGHVAHAAQALWRELDAERDRGRQFAVWPFEHPAIGWPVVAEIYPSVAYRTALGGPLGGSKGQRAVRDGAIERVVRLPWVAAATLKLDGLEEARSNDDDFDALMTVLALVRLVIEGRPLTRYVEPVAEGAILADTAVE